MSKGKNYTFTSESVCAGHPDKICDSISDSILDIVLKHDPHGKVAVECLAGFNHLIIAGEVTTKNKINFERIARQRIRDLGYTDPKLNFSDKSKILVHVHEQSPEIARGVARKGAGDQGMMFGFACRETEDLMPLPITIAHKLAKNLDKVKQTFKYLRPDGKTQVTIEYKNGLPYKVKQVIIAVPHEEKIELEQVKKDLFEKVVKPVLGEFGFSVQPKNVIVNGTGVWHMPGPASDAGLTGRKIIVDTYGGYARVGGGAFSGKDPTKVDRSGAYAARFLAKNIVAQKLADKAEVRLAYFIGAKKPVMQEVETFGTEKVSHKVISDFMKKILDTSVEGIIDGLNLRRPIYLQTSTYGHFGRPEFSWEKII
ncbi:MAG: methionine adenosyltransferase [Candidatus Levybacteria bacterium]|nr:methionine adenosyltransferase [Candidatus Levybacteria bacterium]